MIGAGIVVMPFMLLHTGTTLGFWVFTADACLATLSIYIIHTVSIQTDSNSFEEIASYKFGAKAKYIVNTLLILALAGPTISYFIIMGDIAKNQFPEYPPLQTKCLAIMAADLLVLWFCLQKSLANISITSITVVAGLVVFVSVIAYNLIKTEILST